MSAESSKTWRRILFLLSGLIILLALIGLVWQSADANSSNCATQPYIVNDTTTLNQAIDCFNTTADAGTVTISFSDNISLTATTTTLNNATAGVVLQINGNGLTLDVQSLGRGIEVAPATVVTIDSLTIQNGRTTLGGGILNEGALQLNGCQVLSSYAFSDGGGIYNSGMLTLNNTIVAGNLTDYGGGGIFNIGTLLVNNSTVAGNSAENGGGIINYAGTATVNNSAFTNNAADYGGGLYNYGEALTINGSTVSGNTAISGGGLDNISGTATISNSTFSGNSVTNLGGGIANLVTLTIHNSTLSDNSALYGGGLFDSSRLVTTQIHNSIIANSSSGGDCLFSFRDPMFNHSLVEDGSCNISRVGNLTGDPNLNPLANNGGATQTHLPAANSIVIDAGDNATCIAADQRGEARDDLNCDIGAVEFKPGDPTAVTMQMINTHSPLHMRLLVVVWAIGLVVLTVRLRCRLATATWIGFACWRALLRALRRISATVQRWS